MDDLLHKAVGVTLTSVAALLALGAAANAVIENPTAGGVGLAIFYLIVGAGICASVIRDRF